jgi:uncharacterized OsmC-like protein
MERFTSRVHSKMVWPAKIETQNGLTIDFSKPPEYRGMKGTMTPEDAFVGAVIMCLACTFDSYSAKMRLAVSGFEAEGTGIVDRKDGVEMFTEITVRVKITIPPETQREAVQKAFERARDNCLVAASLKTPVKYELEISSA